ncbi:S9 family peptidase [Phenylobacterium sp.]|uniref:S9 family peptidase n=1 Tax=Phenylobacterium sp. TaxID=1871053 RepID=UPI002DE6983B|nr:prolyl oligopeptidase family serine peptidase [Phenylobacterium sp.]
MMFKLPGRMRLSTAAVSVAAILAPWPATAAPRAPAHGFTIEQVLSAPFPSSLVAAGQGGRVAWVFDKDGSRNVWVAEPGANGAFTAHPISAYAGDDGVDLGELDWTSDGRHVVYSRGGSLEGGGPVNVLSKPSGALGQEIWVASVDGTATRRIGPGHSAAASPRDDVVAYIEAGQVWVAPLAAGGQPTQLIHDRGRSGQIAWSPDGSRLAFVSSRGDHSLVGVYDFAAKTIVWLSPSVDRDVAPTWSPDGRSLAYARIAASNAGLFADSHEAQPWSLWVGDPVTGAATAVWTASAGAGSAFHPLESETNLMWTADNRLVFPWERSGWLQLYSISPAGGEPTRLTHGDFEVFSASLSADRKRIVYSSNEGDIDHRHLWELAGGTPRQLTRGATIEDSPAVTSDGRIVALHGDWRKPIRPVSLTAAGQLVELAAAAMPADFPAARLTEPKQVVFISPDGVKVHGQLFLPPAGRTGRGPAILFFHGGPTRQMLLGWHPMDAYAYMYGLNQYLADEGYVVLSVNYRGGSGYGLDFREAKAFGAKGASEDNDIVGAAKYLASRADVDAARIGIWGGSYGGLMTALGLSRHSDLLAAGVDYAGVHDWSTIGGRLGPGAGDPAADLALKSSPMGAIDKWKSPVLLIHADDDRNVPFSQTVEVVEGLRRHNVEFEQIVLPDEIHDLLRAASWNRFFHATDDFFARHLHSQPARR